MLFGVWSVAMTTIRAKTAGELSLAELAKKTGCPARTIRFYIARGILAGPKKAGRGASYGSEHVQRISEIRAWQARGLTLTEIVHKLAGDQQPMRVMEAPTAWWAYQVQPDVIVQVRADASPWRLRQIQRALKDATNRLAQPTTEEDDHENR